MGAGEDLRVRLVEEFAAFGPAYMRWVKSRLQEGGISYARMRLLSVLRCKGPQIMSSLSQGLGVTPRNVTALVDALEEEGWSGVGPTLPIGGLFSLNSLHRVPKPVSPRTPSMPKLSQSYSPTCPKLIKESCSAS